MKIRDKIKLKFIKFLGIDKLIEDINNSNKNQDHINDSIKREIANNKREINHNANDIEKLNTTVESIVSIGVDIVPHYDNNRSWAVVCVQGRFNIVKFIDLRGMDYNEILRYLKQFEVSRRVIDAPNSEFLEKCFKFQ